MNLPNFLLASCVLGIAYSVIATPEGRSLAKRVADFLKEDLANSTESQAPSPTENTSTTSNSEKEK